MRIIVFESLDEMALKALQWLTEKTAAQDTVSVALSGGNTPQALFERIVKLDQGTVDWNKLLVFWGDERCVPPEHTDSNFRSAQKSILIPLDIPEEHIFRMQGEAEPEKEAERYRQLLTEHLPIVTGTPHPFSRAITAYLRRPSFVPLPSIQKVGSNELR
ncbi:MAG: 6-phosphogluconolactonase [Bacteroidia bacterium]|nr:6-phosphogluconolactonase [Bacteroidia bacterium]